MNFPEHRTLAMRAKRVDPIPEDEFEDNQLENPGWVRKYLDLADRFIQESKEEAREEEEFRERTRSAATRKLPKAS